MLHEKKLTIFGAGMMGSALARGLVRAGAMAASGITLYDAHPYKAQQVAREVGEAAHAAESPEAAAEGADILLIAVKPPVVESVLTAIAPAITGQQLLISIAAGVRVAKME